MLNMHLPFLIMSSAAITARLIQNRYDCMPENSNDKRVMNEI